MKKIAALIFLMIIALVGWKVYDKVSHASSKSDFQGKSRVVAVKVTQVKKDTIRDIGVFTGTLLPSTQFIVSPKLGGRLEKLLVNIGDTVTNGQLIAVLDDDEYQQQLEQARAELNVSNANLEQALSAKNAAEREHIRLQTLHRKKIASDAELDIAKTQYEAKIASHKVALAQIERYKAAKNAAEIRVSYTQITVRWRDKKDRDKDNKKENTKEKTRKVGERFIEEGAMLRPHESIVSILDIDSLIGVINITDKDHSKVKIGQKAVITTDAFPGKQFEGTTARIAPLLKEKSRLARVEIDIPNPDTLLKPGMFIRVQIEFVKHENATIIPVTALARRNNQQGVFTADIKEKKAGFIPVTLGIIEDERAEVLTPAELSGWIVILGHHLLEHGTPISIPQMNRNEIPEKKPGSAINDKPGTGKKREQQ